MKVKKSKKKQILRLKRKKDIFRGYISDSIFAQGMFYISNHHS